MINFIEDLPIMSGGDGEFIEGGLPTPPEPAEIDRLLQARSEERGGRIEGLLLLGRVRRLLSRLRAAGRFTDQERREVGSLLRLIDSIGRGGIEV